jgi:hypothetical protein
MPKDKRGGMGTPAHDKVRLYELVLENGRSVSPFVWRIRYALAHKGVPFECVPIGFTDIPRVFGGQFKTVPVIEHGSTMLAESFSGPAEYAMVRLTDSWFSADILRKMFRLYVLDVHNAARPEDRPYFSTESRGIPQWDFAGRVHG